MIVLNEFGIQRLVMVLNLDLTLLAKFRVKESLLTQSGTANPCSGNSRYSDQTQGRKRVELSGSPSYLGSILPLQIYLIV